MVMVVGFLLIEWIGREDQYAIEKVGLTWNRPLRWSFYFGVIASLFIFSGQEQEFIYFQF